MKSNSIQSRLILRLIIPMILFNLVIFAFVFLLFDKKINDFFDQTLLASAKSIEDKVLVEYGTLIVNLPYFTIDMLENTSKGHVFYSVENEKGEIIAGFDNIPEPKNKNLSVQFYNSTFFDHPVRIIYLQRDILKEDGIYSTKIKIAASLNNRESILREILVILISISIVIILTAIVVSSLGLRNALSPLYYLQKKLRQRDVNDLKAIQAYVPIEVQTLIDSINNLFIRIKGNISYIETFNADVSHQLRTPLAELKAFVQLNDKKIDVNYYKKMGLIDNMAHTINQLLFYAKTNPNSFNTEHFEVVNIVELCKTIFEKLVPTIYDNDFEFEFICEYDYLSIKCDVILIEALISNLINNSIKYSPSNDKKGLISIEIVKLHEKIRLIVADQGKGIERIHHENVFKRFVRLDCDKQGTGLGLNIVAQIVHLHKAEIFLKNKADSFQVIVDFKTFKN